MLSLIQPVITNLLLWIWIGTALFLWWITRRNRRFRIYGFCFLALFWVMSTRPVADSILLALESSYCAPSISSIRLQGVDQIVVLAGGGGGLRRGKDRSQTSDVRDPQITQKEKEQVSRKGAKSLRGKEDERTEDRYGRAEDGASISVLPHATAYRLWGALELASRLGPNCELILIGSPNGDTRIMKELAHVLMPERKVVSKTHLGGTSEHPKNVEPFVGERPFIFVTSAMHMKRTKKKGVSP